MCVISLKYYLHYQPGSNIIIVYLKQITYTVVIITHYKRMCYVIIPKPNCSIREGINSSCRRFDFFAVRLKLSPL